MHPACFAIVLLQARPRNTLFTGSSRVAERLSRELHGKIKIEDAGFDWKVRRSIDMSYAQSSCHITQVLGPDYKPEWMDYVAWQSDQDAYSCSGQKCSAQSILFAHSRWVKAGLYEKLEVRLTKGYFSPCHVMLTFVSCRLWLLAAS